MLREFLYVDMTRTRSLLAQLDEGVVETTVKKRSTSRGVDLNAAVSAIKAGFKRSDSSESAQTRSLEDFLFVALEEIIEAEGILQDVDCGSISDWEDSTFHGRMREGQPIRVNADVMFLDPTFVKARLDRLMNFFGSMTAFQEQKVDAQSQLMRQAADRKIEEAVAKAPRDRRSDTKRTKEKEANKAVEDFKQKQLSKLGATTDEVQPVVEMMSDFLESDSIAVRVLPFGREETSYSFVGSLLGRDEYIQPEREALFSRYGAVVSGWTCVLQVAAIPSREPVEEMDFSELGKDMVNEGVVDRGKMESLALRLLSQLESMGLAEGPRWPTVSVVPLGIYRTIPASIPERESA